MPSEHPRLKLGKQPPKFDDRTAIIRHFFPDKTLPVAPPGDIDVSLGVKQFPMFLNDQLGDCAIAGPAHMEEVFGQAVRGAPTMLTDDDVLKAYSAVSGYDPNTGANDNGCVLLDVLRYWRKVGIGGHTLYGFGRVNYLDKEAVRNALWLFDGLDCGVQLPITAQSQIGKVWEVVPQYGNEPGSWGGHCVHMVAANDIGPVYVTWGALQQATWEWHLTYGDEAWAVVPHDYASLNGKALANGFDMDQLEKFLSAL